MWVDIGLERPVQIDVWMGLTLLTNCVCKKKNTIYHISFDFYVCGLSDGIIRYCTCYAKSRYVQYIGWSLYAKCTPIHYILSGHSLKNKQANGFRCYFFWGCLKSFCCSYSFINICPFSQTPLCCWMVRAWAVSINLCSHQPTPNQRPAHPPLPRKEPY